MTEPEGHRDPAEAFTELVRAKVGSIRAAIETLERFPGIDAGRAAQLRAVIVEEAAALSRAVDETTAALAAAGGRRRRLLTGAGGDLLAALARDLAGRAAIETAVEPTGATFRVAADRTALADALGRVLARLGEEFGVDRATLRLRAEETFATLDLVWSYGDADVETVFGWQSRLMADEVDSAADALRAVARRHGGETWFNLERDADRAYLRLLLPLAKKRGARPKRPRPR